MSRSRVVFAGMLFILLSSCLGESPRPSPTAEAGATPAAATPDAPASPQPVTGTMPMGYEPDVGPAEVPPAAIVPRRATPTGEWFAFTDRGVMIVVAWAEPGEDITRQPRGVAVWRSATSPPHWRLAWVRRRGARAALTEVQATAADVTGDGSDDLLVFEGTSGSGGCGSWLVVELLSLERIFQDELCDARIEPAPEGSSGLVLTESVYRPGDSHCCPSAIRRTELVWTGSDWAIGERTQTEA